MINKDALKQVLKNMPYYQINKLNTYKTTPNFTSLKKDEKPHRYKLCPCKNVYFTDKVNQLLQMMDNTIITIDGNSRFQSWIDVGLFVYSNRSITDNVPPDYSLIVKSSLEDIFNLYQGDSDFERNEQRLINGVLLYVDKIISAIEEKICKEDDQITVDRLRKVKDSFQNMKSKPAQNLFDGLQRIIFWSSLFWQSRHRLVGIGRLDKLLSDLPTDVSGEEVILLIQDFYSAMHKYYAFKSNDLMGDTGQIIELGGREPNGEYFCNHLTYAFIKAAKEQRLPDPKILLRVCDNTPDDLLKLAVECIGTGVGYPLLANDGTIIPAISEVYNPDDAYNYVTSACWEPLIYGKSLDKNNLSGLNFAMAVVYMYRDDRFSSCQNFNDVKSLYFDNLNAELERVRNKVDKIRWEPDPLMSLFTEECLARKMDISEGGAYYCNYGVLGVGLGNAINSLLAVRDLVFGSGKYSLEDLKQAAISNYDESVELLLTLKKTDYYGRDDDATTITKEVVEYVHDYFYNYKNKFGGLLKFGLSASNYKESGDITPATIDGRRNGDPLGVHISSHGCNSYTELVNFASKLNYKGIRCNGNVIDFFVSPFLINSNPDKFVLFIKSAIKQGFFQMQMNVVDSKTLIKAKNTPQNYEYLVVRVWGFSAYFNDLPEEYKDLLIERAKQSEGIV